MTTQKTLLDIRKLLFKVLFLLLITVVTSACLSTDTVAPKTDIVQIVFNDDADTTLIDFGTTKIGATTIPKKTFKLTNRSKLDVHVVFTIPEGYHRATSDVLGKKCDTNATMFVKGKDVCYFAIAFEPEVRLTHADKAPLSILVDIDDAEYSYENILTMQGISENSQSITFSNNLDFGSTAKNSSKIRAVTLYNKTEQDIFYNVVLPENITIDPTSTCKPSNTLDDLSSCEMVLRFDVENALNTITKKISVEQDTGNSDIAASIDVTSSTIANIVGPASRYDASMIISGSKETDGEIKLIGGKNDITDDISTNNIWVFNILKKVWTFQKQAPFEYIDNESISQNIEVLYGNRVTVVGSRTLILPGQITLTPPATIDIADIYSPLATAENIFDNKTFRLKADNTVERIDSITDNARNNYKIATNKTTNKVYIYGGIHKKVSTTGGVETVTYTLTDNISLVLDNGSFENIVTKDNPDRHLAAFASANNKFYLFGGSTKDNVTPMSKSLYEYDNKTETWSDIIDASTGSNILLNNNRAEMVTLNDDGASLYVFGGNFETSVSESQKTTLYKYSIDNKLWTGITDTIMPPARTGHNLVPFMNKYIYLFGGVTSDNKPTNDLWVFDTTTNKWEKINLPLLNQKLDHQAVTASKDGRYIYIYGGQTADGTASTKFMVYDTELNFFKELAEIGTGTEFHRFGHQLVSAKDGNVILLIGGSTAINKTPVTKHYQYDIKENKWAPLTPTGSSADINIADHTAVNKDDTIYILGGRKTTSGALKNVMTLTFADNETTTQPTVTNLNKPMKTARFKYSATLVGDDIYVAGGNISSANKTDTVEKFDTTNNTWSDSSPLLDKVSNSSLVADGTTLYFIGGINATSDTSISTVYKSVSGGTWEVVTAGDGLTLDGEVMFKGQTYFIKVNGAFINFAGDVLSIIYP